MKTLIPVSLLAALAPWPVAFPLAPLQTPPCQPEFHHMPVEYNASFSGTPVIVDIEAWDPDGDGPAGQFIVVSGAFDSIDATTDRILAYWDLENGAWSQPIPALPGAFGLSVATGPDGRLAATAAPEGVGQGPSEIFEWDGTAWQKLPPLEEGLVGSPTALKYDSQGRLYCLGFVDLDSFTSRVGVWDGTQWQLLGSGFAIGAIDLQIAPNDDVFVSAGPNFGAPSATIIPMSRWNGTQWVPEFTGTQVVAQAVEGFTFLSDGRVAATGSFDDGGPEGPRKWAIWSGVDWEIPPSTPAVTGVNYLGLTAELPTGEVLFAENMPSESGELAECFAKWDGVTLKPFASVPQGSVGSLREVFVDATGTVWAGGAWNLSTSSPAGSGLSRTVLPCAATANPLGIAGQGSAGAVQLSAQSLPWLGGTFRASVDGLAPLAVPFTLIGAQLGAQPLANLTPLADAASFLYLQPNLALTEVLTNQQGAAQFETSLPSDASLTGLLIGLQVASLELDALGQPVSIATSNALALTFGSY